MMTGLGWERIREALAILEAQPRGGDRLLRIVERLRGALRFRRR